VYWSKTVPIPFDNVDAFLLVCQQNLMVTLMEDPNKEIEALIKSLELAHLNKQLDSDGIAKLAELRQHYSLIAGGKTTLLQFGIGH